MAKLTVIDYGRGNLLSLNRALEHCGARIESVADPESILKADRLILPGVGAFGDAADELNRMGLAEAIKEYATLERPFLGICVGMQLMFDTGNEFGTCPGLGLIPGKVIAIPNTTSDGELLKVPHIGWSATTPKLASSWQGSILEGLPNPAWLYFVHSFAARPINNKNTIGTCLHGDHEIPAIVHRDALWGCQFHPEKSGQIGLSILENFIAL